MCNWPPQNVLFVSTDPIKTRYAHLTPSFVLSYFNLEVLVLSGCLFVLFLISSRPYLCDIWCFAMFILLLEEFPWTLKLYCKTCTKYHLKTCCVQLTPWKRVQMTTSKIVMYIQVPHPNVLWQLTTSKSTVGNWPPLKNCYLQLIP